MTTAELIREVQVAKLCDPFVADLLQLEIDHRLAAMDGSSRAKMTASTAITQAGPPAAARRPDH